MKKPHGPSRKGLWIIAIFKFLKGTLLLAVGFGALRLLHHDVAMIARHYINALRVDPENHFFHRLVAQLGLVDDHTLARLSVGTFFYSALMYTEGIGLYLEKRWGEYLTIIATSSLIPLEIYEIFRHLTWFKLVVLAINLAVVVYLIKIIRNNHAK